MSYKYENGFIVEQPTMEKPELYYFGMGNLNYLEQMNVYASHIKNLRRYPVPPEYRHVWKEGEDVTGKFKVVNNEFDIYAKKGTKVTTNELSMTRGSSYDKENTEGYLKAGEIYTVELTDVGSWHTDVFLQEFPGIAFNSVRFISPDRVAIPIEPKLKVDEQDALWGEVINESRFYDGSPNNFTRLTDYFKLRFTISRIVPIEPKQQDQPLQDFRQMDLLNKAAAIIIDLPYTKRCQEQQNETTNKVEVPATETQVQYYERVIEEKEIEIERLREENKDLKILLPFTDCPQVFIDYPKLFKGRKPTKEDVEWALREIKKFENTKP